jgi:hypothetical protein
MANDLKVQAESAALRGQGRPTESIALVEQHIASGKYDPDVLTPLYIEVFRAAEQAGDKERIAKYVKLIYSREPKLPSIQRYLSGGKPVS